MGLAHGERDIAGFPLIAGAERKKEENLGGGRKERSSSGGYRARSGKLR